MPPLSQHHSAQTTKLLLIGDSGSGKTGALASLAAAGYNLRIIDFDNGIDVLKNYLTNPNSIYVKKSPDCASRVHYMTVTDKMRTVQGKIFPMAAQAWSQGISLIEHWKEPQPWQDKATTPPVDFGRLTDWGPQDVLVIDSLTMVSVAAMNFHLFMNGVLGQTRGGYDYQRDIGSTQGIVRTLLEMLYDSNVKCNVVVTAHITFANELGQKSKENEPLPMQGYPSAIGRALSPHIPRYFNSVLFAKTVGSGQAARHKIYTVSQGTVNVKSSAPLSVAPEYPLETGLADYFAALRKAQEAKPALPAKTQ